MLGRLSAQGEQPSPPPADSLDGLTGKALSRAEADRTYRRALAQWQSDTLGAMWLWDALVLRASSTAADVATLDASTLPTVARAFLRRALSAE